MKDNQIKRALIIPTEAVVGKDGNVETVIAEIHTRTEAEGQEAIGLLNEMGVKAEPVQARGKANSKSFSMAGTMSQKRFDHIFRNGQSQN